MSRSTRPSTSRPGASRLGYRAAFAAFAFALSACASAPVMTGGAPSRPSATQAPASGYAAQKLSANRYRIVFSGDTAPANFRSEAMKRAAQATLDSGQEWFEIVGSSKTSLDIVMGSGESLAGGATQYDARDTLRGGSRTS
jgi:hypothetical protein